MVAQNLFFFAIAAVIVYSGFRVVTSDNVVHAALHLVAVLASVAAQYVLLAAEFVAATKVLVYIGAIVVLFLFGIMLTRAKLGVDDTVGKERHLMAILVAVLLMGVMGYALVDGFREVKVGERDPLLNTAVVSDSIFSQYLIPFEVVSMLLLAALIGAIVVARKD